MLTSSSGRPPPTCWSRLAAISARFCRTGSAPLAFWSPCAGGTEEAPAVGGAGRGSPSLGSGRLLPATQVWPSQYRM
ncbi:hypothetical protein FH609_026915 [Streptomyces sp. 3MP-14]|uniref:Uncharacterized protein n=1 Tax=Streptomyces mimosae TaxID=2586635 RepID=A0A5N6A264_9ACTN|nr:hypothetical protein FH607_025480 [Streptomyces mimosae]KAB8173248.1 hypothetical protein FH609_026915 [Streptomyces sp. 3MP-14]